MNVNPSNIKSLTTLNSTAKKILELLSERQRNTKYTAFHSFRAMLKQRYKTEVNRSEFDNTFNKLEKLGAGKIKKSVRNKNEGFFWYMKVSDIGEALKQNVKPNIKLISSDVNPLSAVSIVIIRSRSKPEVIETDEKHVDRVIDSLRL